MQRGCFITATDTGVGKTTVTAALARRLASDDLRPGVMKPIETGMRPDRAREADTARLQRAAGSAEPRSLVCPYAFPDALAPLAAGRRAGVTIEFARIREAYRTLAARHDLMLVEGVGGVRVPITARADTRDLIEALGLPVLVVGRAGLGGINHALLTVESLTARNLRVLGLVLNQPSPEPEDSDVTLQRESTAELIRELADVPVMGPLPHVAGLDRHWDHGIAQLAATPAIADLTRLLQATAS
jgi:dethiobiotin synthetase